MDYTYHRHIQKTKTSTVPTAVPE